MSTPAAKLSIDGSVRKVALVTVTLSAIGYVIFVIGWGTLLSYISAGGFILYNTGAVVYAYNRIGYTSVYSHETNAIFAGMVITQIFSALARKYIYFQMVTGAILGAIDIKRGKELQTA
eukprot:Em0001g3263a